MSEQIRQDVDSGISIAEKLGIDNNTLRTLFDGTPAVKTILSHAIWEGASRDLLKHILMKSSYPGVFVEDELEKNIRSMSLNGNQGVLANIKLRVNPFPSTEGYMRHLKHLTFFRNNYVHGYRNLSLNFSDVCKCKTDNERRQIIIDFCPIEPKAIPSPLPIIMFNDLCNGSISNMTLRFLDHCKDIQEFTSKISDKMRTNTQPR